MITIEQAHRQAAERALKLNPPAFPTTHNGTGMTLRDWFAGKAMQGLLSDSELKGTAADFAGRAYGLADAMLAERNKT